MTLGQKIKELRQKKNLSVEDLASHIDVTRQNVYHYENDKMRPRPDKLRAIAALFHITVEELLKVEVENSQAWYLGLIDEYREKEKQYLAQIDRLTQMLATQLGKLEDVIFGGFETNSVTNSVTSGLK